MLVDGLQSDKGLLPLQHEMTTITHLLLNGFNVTCHDLENNGGFDFLASRDGVEVEVECKMVSGDIGKQLR